MAQRMYTDTRSLLLRTGIPSWRRRRTPPFLPQLKDQTDVSNFDEPLSDDSFVNEPPYDYSRSDWDRDFDPRYSTLCVPRRLLSWSVGAA